MTYFKKDHNGSPAIYNDDGLVAVFEIEEERNGFFEVFMSLHRMRSLWWNECWEHGYSKTEGNEVLASEFASNDSHIIMIDKAFKKLGI